MEKKSHVHFRENSEKRGIHHRIHSHIKQHKTKYLVGVLFAVVIILIFLFIINLFPKYARQGDNVEVNYIGTLDDGKIFDTSFESVAKANSIYTPNRAYTPLQFVIGDGKVLKDFNDAVIGMRKGEVKKVRIESENAYPVDSSLVVNGIPIVIDIQNKYTVTTDNFLGVVAGGRAEVGGVYTLPQLPWKVRVTDMNKSSGQLTFSALANIGDNMPMPYRSWNATIISVNDKTIKVKQDVHLGDVIATPDGMTGKISEIGVDTYNVDMNMPLAGKPLNFEITLVDIKR